MQEELPIVKQVFNLCFWLQKNTKLNVMFSMDGSTDEINISIKAGEKEIIAFTLESFTKKSEERINIEFKLLVPQLIQLKNDEHFK